MSLLVIELNDAGIRAARAPHGDLLAVDGEQRFSPGVAHVTAGAGDSLVTGFAAAERASAHPLGVRDQFWDQLDTEPVDPRDPRSPNRAEVAFAHLRQIAERVREPDDEVVLAVPPRYDERQLGLLVGIARELELPLRGLVASPVAHLDAALGEAALGEGAVMLVELSLHRCLLSIVETSPRITLVRTRVCPDVGLLAFRRQWIRSIGNEFVRKTRFDPLHDAATERQVQGELATLLETVARDGTSPLAVQAGSRVHRVTVTDQMLEHAGHALVFELCRDVQAELETAAVSAIRLTNDAGGVPGLAGTLRRQVARPVSILEAGSAARGLTTLWPTRFDQSAAPAVAYHDAREAEHTEATG